VHLSFCPLGTQRGTARGLANVSVRIAGQIVSKKDRPEPRERHIVAYFNLFWWTETLTTSTTFTIRSGPVPCSHRGGETVLMALPGHFSSLLSLLKSRSCSKVGLLAVSICCTWCRAQSHNACFGALSVYLCSRVQLLQVLDTHCAMPGSFEWPFGSSDTRL
jgi:hypothetical protein